jgi:hypothetical protein
MRAAKPEVPESEGEEESAMDAMDVHGEGRRPPVVVTESPMTLPAWSPARALAGVGLAPRVNNKALTVWPLRSSAPRPAPEARAVPLARALEDGFAGLEAMGPQALRVENRGPAPLLVVAGEELSGERWGGCAATSVLVPPHDDARVQLVPQEERRAGLRRDLVPWLRALRPLPGQVGLVAAFGDRILGVELMGGAALLAQVLPTLLASHWMRAIRVAFACGPTVPPRFDAPEALLEALVAVHVRGRPAPGAGRSLVLEGDGVRGQALLLGDELVHLTARPAPSAHPGRG